jgi:hypothetical protein
MQCILPGIDTNGDECGARFRHGMVLLLLAHTSMLARRAGARPVHPILGHQVTKTRRMRMQWAHAANLLCDQRWLVPRFRELPMSHRPVWISNLTKPSSRIFKRRAWQASAFATLARFMIS